MLPSSSRSELTGNPQRRSLMLRVGPLEKNINAARHKAIRIALIIINMREPIVVKRNGKVKYRASTNRLKIILIKVDS